MWTVVDRNWMGSVVVVGGVVMGRLRDVRAFVVFCVLRLKSLRTGVFSGG
jgi:hypothetical protein